MAGGEDRCAPYTGLHPCTLSTPIQHSHLSPYSILLLAYKTCDNFSSTLPMNKRKLLNFEYADCSSELVDAELQIKQDLRNVSYNIEEEREVQRYFDKYFDTISRADVMKTVNIELLSPELISMYGGELGRDIEVIHRDISDGESEGASSSTKEDESLQGEDDYVFYNEDEEPDSEEKDYEGPVI